MIRTLKALFESPQSENRESLEPDLRLAAAALLVETARADFTEDEIELNRLSQLLKRPLHSTSSPKSSTITAAQIKSYN